MADEQPDDHELQPDDELAFDDELQLDDEPSRDDLVAAARRRHGMAGGMLAAGLFGLEQVLGRKAKEEAPVVVAASTEPVDIDTDGIIIEVDDDISVVAPPLPRRGEPARNSLRKRTKRRRNA